MKRSIQEIVIENDLTKLESNPNVKDYLDVLHQVLDYTGQKQQSYMDRCGQIRIKLKEDIRKLK